MPLKINVSISKKTGLPDYGSVGAMCGVEFQVDSSLPQDDVAAFQSHVHNAYAACARAVNEELARQQQVGNENNGPRTGSTEDRSRSKGRPRSSPAGENANGNGNGARPVTEKQMTFIRQLAGQIKGLGVRRLDTLADNMFGKPLAGLSSFEASGVIDCLKGIKAGEINLDNALNGATT